MLFTQIPQQYAPLFRWLRRYVHRRIRKEAGDE